MHRERGALDGAGPIAYATFATRLQFAPTSWAGAPSKACARGPLSPPLPPPPHLGTPLILDELYGKYTLG